jgi:hypothetical protein
MNRPSLSDRLIGNRLAVLGLLCLTGFVTFRWGTQRQHGEHVSWIVPAVAWVVSRASLRARRRVTEYGGWKRDWDEMSGAAEVRRERRRQRARITRPLTILAAGFICFCTCSWTVVHASEYQTRAFGCVALVFAASALWLGVTGMAAAVRFMRRAPRIARTAAAKRDRRQFIVSVCLGMPWPWARPSLKRITASLPAYCKPLLLARPDTARQPEPQAQPEASPQ